MSNMVGMDVAGVRQLATQMHSAASEIKTLMDQLTSALNSTTWVGQDREHFVNEWQSQHCNQLNQVIQGLTDASGKANQNASDQENTSNS